MKSFKDAEYRLFDILINIADWDKKHKETFGTTNESLRDIKKHYLSEWSVGKLSKITNSLIQRGDVIRKAGGEIQIKNFWRFVSSDVQRVEQDFQSDEQDVRCSEQDVQPNEQIEKIKNCDTLEESKLETIKNNSVVQPDEHQENPKETLKKLKEHQTNYEMLLIKKYGNDINVPIKRYGVEQVSEAARVMECRINEGEVVKNKVGCITNLCKEGVKLEGSEWQLREKQRNIREEEKRRKFEESIRPRSPEQQERTNKKLKEMREHFKW